MLYTYVWNEEMLESFFKSLQRHTAEEENDENQIRKCCCDVNHLEKKKDQQTCNILFTYHFMHQ